MESEQSDDPRTLLLNRPILTSYVVNNSIDNSPPQTKTYKRRWYILVLFSLEVVLQNLIWNTWGPISSSAKAVFHWTDTEIALFPAWGTICFVIFVIPLIWLINNKGLRISVLLASFLAAAGTALRCITSDEKLATWLINTGQVLNGIAGPVIMAMPSAISAVWFPAFQRTTATAVGVSCGALGAAFSFLFGPLIVSQPNSTNVSVNNISDFSEQRNEIMYLMYIECALATGVFLLFLVYFPNKPPLPPTLSASISRYDFKEGILLLLKNHQFWLIGLSIGIYNGVFYGWMAVLTPFLATKNFSQLESGWLGFYSLIAGQVAALIISWFLDKLNQKLKMSLIVSEGIYLGFLIWLALSWNNVVTFSKVNIYIIYIVLNMFNFCTVPIYYELTIEAMYPINEGVIAGALNVFTNGVMTIFLIVESSFSSNSLGQDWMVWCLICSVLASLPLLFYFKGVYNRLNIDISERTSLLSSP